LAIATVWLARATRRDVAISRFAAEAAAKSAHVSEAALETALRPVLVNDSQHPISVQPGGDGVTLRLSVPLRNVGSGLALLAGPDVDLPATQVRHLESTTSESALRSGDAVSLEIVATCRNAADLTAFEGELTGSGFSVVASYRDLNGKQPGRTEAVLAYDPSKGWGFKEVRLFTGESTEPFAALPRSVTVHVRN
jgi:hypothetical protein